ncbi:MAG: rpe [Candidatus Saccharibacteria bacterium]|nr:rpe [Candidatus Saccharibacteria bacterium]
MSVIAPCITTETADAYKVAVEKLSLFAHRVHIDVSDGEFTPSFLLPVQQLWWPQQWTVDIHAMVSRPEDYVAALINLKPHLITFHVETQTPLLPIISQIKQAGIQAGIALMRPTVPSTVAELIKAADHVMIFSGDLGHYGGKASLMQVEKIRLIRAINPAVEIGWDGGVSLENAYTLSQGGVDVLNAGGAIAMAPDPAAAYANLEVEMKKHGVI